MRCHPTPDNVGRVDGAAHPRRTRAARTDHPERPRLRETEATGVVREVVVVFPPAPGAPCSARRARFQRPAQSPRSETTTPRMGDRSHTARAEDLRCPHVPGSAQWDPHPAATPPCSAPRWPPDRTRALRRTTAQTAATEQGASRVSTRDQLPADNWC